MAQQPGSLKTISTEFAGGRGGICARVSECHMNDQVLPTSLRAQMQPRLHLEDILHAHLRGAQG